MRAERLFAAMLVSGLSISLIAALPGAARGQALAPTTAEHHVRILGVYDQDSGDAVEGVRVSDLLSGTYATTTQTGTVALSFLPDGGGLVRIQKVGFLPQTLFVAMTPADTAPLTLILARLTELPAVLTTDAAPHYLSPSLRGFEERRHAGQGGYFVGEEVLRKAENSSVGNIVRRFPGMKVLPGADATWLLPTVRCNDGSHPGPPQVYLDGVAWSPPIRPGVPHLGRKDVDGLAFNLDDFEIVNLAGVEFYPDNTTLPIGLSHNAQRCGALFLWTREH